MDYSYLNQNTFELNEEAVHLNRVVLLPDEKAADVFMKNVFIHYCGYVVASADRAYPKHEGLRKRTFECLSTRDDLALVVFGFDSLKKIQLKTNRLLVMDDFILRIFTKWSPFQVFHRDLDAYKISGWLRSYFEQWDKIEHLGNFTPYYYNYSGFDRKKMGWILDLIVEHNRPKIIDKLLDYRKYFNRRGRNANI